MQADELTKEVQAILKEKVRESWARWRKGDDLPNQSLRWEGHDAAFFQQGLEAGMGHERCPAVR